MTIKLIEGTFNSQEAVDLITALIQTKIKFHENRISIENEEDIKMREKKIKRLQNSLHDFRNELNQQNVNLNCEISIL